LELIWAGEDATVNDDQIGPFRDYEISKPATPTQPESPEWPPSLAGLLISGSIAGAILGAANAVLLHYIVGAFESPQAASEWGAGLGLAGGVLIVFLRHSIWGPDRNVSIATVLGLLYGVVPGTAILVQSIAVNHAVAVKSLGGMVMAGSMVGLIIGGVLDRLSESIMSPTSRSSRDDR
jgi:H+/Cl- antiporter ClcA